MGYKQRVLDSLPERLHPLAKGAYYTIYPERHPDHDPPVNAYAGLPDHNAPLNLPEKHLATTEVLPDRMDLLDTLPTGGTVAELGVAAGDHAAAILNRTDPETLLLVDIWAADRYEAGYAAVQDRFAAEIEAGTVEIRRTRSTDALAALDDNSLDWAYIDTTHELDQTRRELELSRQKVRPDGIIAGHDYCVGIPPKRNSYGVIAAVHEFCVEYDWRIAYLTLETSGHRSFALERIE